MENKPDSDRQPTPPTRTGRLRFSFTAHKSSFIKRSILSTGITLGLVALTVAVYWSRAWAGWYLVSGVWAVVFFALTPLIIKALVFDRRLLAGLSLTALKLIWLGLMLGLCLYATRAGQDSTRLGSALLAGVSTPLVVVVLRALGSLSGKPSSVANRPLVDPPSMINHSPGAQSKS